MLPDFKLCSIVVIKNCVILTQKWIDGIDGQSRIQSPGINPHLSVQSITEKESKNIQWRQDSLFNKECLLETLLIMGNWTATYKRIKLDNFLTPHTAITSKQIKDLNVRLKL